MLKKLLALKHLFGLYGAPQLPGSAAKVPGPYAQSSINRIYDLLFL